MLWADEGKSMAIWVGEVEILELLHRQAALLNFLQHEVNTFMKLSFHLPQLHPLPSMSIHQPFLFLSLLPPTFTAPGPTPSP